MRFLIIEDYIIAQEYTSGEIVGIYIERDR